MKFFERPEFIELNREWRKKLKKAKFDDIEKPNEQLHQHNIRTQCWDDREQILEFFLALDDFMQSARLPRKHRRILELYSRGIYLTEISVEVRMSYAWVKHVIAKYEKIVLDLY